MSKFIIITSINNPTEAVTKFASMQGYKLIVVGDKKSPKQYQVDSCQFLSIESQIDSRFALATKLPFNHYSRKMIGYLEAIYQGAEFIIDTDDDNIPYDNWSFPDLNGEFEALDNDMGFVNVYSLFTDQKIWPRGFPLASINNKIDISAHLKKNQCTVGIWQGLADEDPDVDAIYRLIDNTPCNFKKRGPVVCKKGTLSPFNTQNTLIRKELFSLLYLPTTVTFRYTDILRGLIALPIMWLYGYELGFTQATVMQKRNPHDYFKDFLSEIPMYQTTEIVVETVQASISETNTIETNLYNSYKTLYNKQIVAKEELDILDTWLKDLDSINDSK